MATRIPLPGQGAEALQRGVEQGGNMFANLLGQGVNLGRMHQQGQQFAQSHDLARQQLAQNQQQHMQNLDILQRKLALAEQSAPWEIDNIKSQIAYHNAQAKDLEFQQNLLNQYLGGSIGGGMGAQPQDMSQPVQAPSMEQLQNGFSNMNPALAGLIKKKTGIDPYAESPQQKQAREMQAFKDKEQYKLEQKANVDQTIPTKAVITANQNVINSANNIIPQIEHLKTMSIPHQAFNLMSPNQQQAYLAQSNAIADGLMSAFGWPKTDQALHMAKSMVHRGRMEGEKEYKKRLDGLIKELEDRRASANNILKSSKVSPAETKKKEKSEENNNDPLGIR